MTTFVLIHGSYQGGWIWQRVANRLRAAGHVTGLIGTVETRLGDLVVDSVRTTPEASDLHGLFAAAVERGNIGVRDLDKRGTRRVDRQQVVDEFISGGPAGRRHHAVAARETLCGS